MKHLTDREHLTRFPITDLAQELIDNQVSPGRHKEIINFYIKHLNDTKYYCLSCYNPMRPKARYNTGICSRTFKCGHGSPSQYFVATNVTILETEIKALVQHVYPQKASDFKLLDEYIVYVSKSELDDLLKNIK